jgi:hypothetical protein
VTRDRRIVLDDTLGNAQQVVARRTHAPLVGRKLMAKEAGARPDGFRGIDEAEPKLVVFRPDREKRRNIGNRIVGLPGPDPDREINPMDVVVVVQGRVIQEIGS